MAITSTPNRVVYSGDGSTTEFSFPYEFFNASDLKVWLWDTVAGGATQQTLNSQYSLSGVPNAQGVYPSVEIEFNVAPASTLQVVIYRDPLRVSNFAQAQNGTINSVALTQAFDYLLLLIQRLDDKISRGILLNDGTGPSINPFLPPNAPLVPGSSPILNATATGWILGGGPFVWQSQVVNYTQLQVAAMNTAIQLFQIPPGYILAGVVIKHSTAFAGTGITDVYVNVGLSTDYTRYIDGFDVLQTVSDSAFDANITSRIESFANTTNVYLQAFSTGANLSNLAAGSLTVNYLLQSLNPFAQEV